MSITAADAAICARMAASTLGRAANCARMADFEHSARAGASGPGAQGRAESDDEQLDLVAVDS